jgi:phosphohistidine phosphatase
MMQLYVLRHAKSSWREDDLPDHERPLARRGRKDAGKVAEYLRKQRIAPALVLCSSSLRTRQTLEAVAGALGSVETRVEGDLYAASAGQMLERLRQLPDETGSVMLIAHNPGCQELAVRLARPDKLRERVESKFPTSGLATLEVTSPTWRSLADGDGRLTAFFAPGDGGKR